MLEGRRWMDTAIKHGGKVVGLSSITRDSGKFYLYQVYTTCFIEFNSMDELNSCVEILDKEEEYWDYDPVLKLSANKVLDRFDRDTEEW